MAHAPAPLPRVRPGGETATHAAAKAALLRACLARGLAARCEVPLPGASEDRRADILVTGPAGERVAIEIQHSPIAPSDLAARSRDYAALGIRVVWLPTLDLATLRPTRLPGARLFALNRFIMPRWHLWVEAQQGGLWYWAEGALWRAWSEPLPAAENANSHDRDEDAPAAARLRAVTLEGPFDPGMVRISTRPTPTGYDTRFPLVPNAAAAFLAAGERRPPPCPTTLGYRLVRGRWAAAPELLAQAA